MSSLPITAVDDIVSYLLPSEKMKISKKYETEVINLSKEKIRKCVSAWALKYKQNMDNNYYHIPKLDYKMFYPLKYRQSFIETVLDLLVEDEERYEQVCQYFVSESLVTAFNKSIDLLSADELFTIGW